jgi:hypothetical protein
MGAERVVGPAADWPAAAGRLRDAGNPAAVKMIDGLPAFPDEEPPADWRELRLGFPAGMVTVRRTADGVRLVTWGTDDPGLTAVLDACEQAWRG